MKTMKGPKKIEIDVEMSGGPMSAMADEAEYADEQQFMEMAPEGKFTPKALMPLVKETNKMLPLFGQTPDYPAIREELGQLPVDFVRVLSMFKAAVDDAIEADVVTPDMAIDLSVIKDDSGLMLLAGKLNSLQKSMEFKRFLKEPMKEEEEMTTVDEERTPMPEMADEEIDETCYEEQCLKWLMKK
jgi:hypothetical protein